MDASSPALPKTKLLADDEPGPAEVVPGASVSAFLIHCDHGGNAIPRRLKNLGLTSGVLERHVGWDIGAAGVARQLAARLEAHAVIGRYSRLAIDLNRAVGDPDCIPPISDTYPIPGNAGLGPDGVSHRTQELYWPYHQTIEWELAKIRLCGYIPIALAIHSFTPALINHLEAKPRPWHCGVMFSRDLRFADLLVAALRQVPGMNVGVNEPYSGIVHGYCMKTHFLARGIPHAQIEIRQDLICTEAGQRWWGQLLADIIAPILGDPSLNEIIHL